MTTILTKEQSEYIQKAAESIEFMRDATPEKQDCIQKNIDKTSVQIGINFYDFLEYLLAKNVKLRKEYEALEEEYEVIEKELKAQQRVNNDSWDDVGTGCFAYWNEE